MKLPEKAPSIESLTRLAENDKSLADAMAAGVGIALDGRYLYWDELIRRPLPKELSVETVWKAMKLQRLALSKTVPLLDSRHRPFGYVTTLPDPASEILRSLDMEAGGPIHREGMPSTALNAKQYIIESIMAESITSSQIEGASTTRKVAEEMIRSHRQPRDHSERMILNNYATMQFVLSLKDAPLTPELVFDLHRRITEGTLSRPEESGRFRTDEERVNVVEANSGDVLYVPPPAKELAHRLRAMCDFANNDFPGHYMHPAVRAIILHFWLAFDHPFVDGNGRTARALFYWSVLRSGFRLFEYVSVSNLIKEAQSQYARAFLLTETDDNDLTYFILYHLSLIRRAIDKIHRTIARKAQETAQLSDRLRCLRDLNPRQRALVTHALKHGTGEYTVRAHMTLQRITHQTARRDLCDLVARGLFTVNRVGKTDCFYPTADLEARLIPGV